MFVPDGARRARVRGNINRVLYTPRIKRFIWRTYHVRVKTIKFIRQINLNRVCLMVNDKYYVKLFRNITPERVQNYKKLTDFVAKHINIRIPTVHADDKMAMYVTEKIAGHGINDFDAATILKNESKIKEQVVDIIKQIQAIKIESIPHHENYTHSLQPERATEPETDKPHPVLAHFDLNETNLLFDDDMNIIGIIDWDMCSVAMNPETDMFVFNRFWNRYKNSRKFKSK